MSDSHIQRPGEMHKVPEEEMTMPTMEEIDYLSSYIKENFEGNTYLQSIVDSVCEAAQRGVEE